MNKKVLVVEIVEDEAVLSKVLRERLMSDGCSVLSAGDGVAGLEMAKSEHPDLILLDILLPKQDGIEMLKELRKDEWGSRAKVIILTNIADPAMIAAGAEGGMGETYDYLIKADWSIDEVMAKFRAKLDLGNK